MIVIIGFLIDHHILSGTTIFGMIIDVVGALFLAYDLLGGREGSLRTLTRVIAYGIVGTLGGLIAFALGFPTAVQFHLRILNILGYYGSLGALLGYMPAWGFAIALGYTFSPYSGRLSKSIKKRLSKSKRYYRRFKKVGELAVWLAFGLICWFSARLIVTSKNSHRLWRKIVLGFGFGMIVGFVIGFFRRKQIRQKTNKNTSYQQEPQRLVHISNSIHELTDLQPVQLKVRTRRFRVTMGFGVGLMMGVLFFIGAIIMARYKLVQGFTSGLIVGLVGGIVNGFLYGFFVRHFLVQDVDKSSLDKPKLDKFSILAGIVVTTTTAFFYAFVVWLLFGGNLIILLLAGSSIGFIGGVIGGITLYITPFIEWKVYTLPERRLGFLGAIMILIGFVIQTLQYWVNLLDLPVK